MTAGGYGPEAWRYTARTLAFLLGGEAAPIPSEAETSLLRFRRLRERLDRRALVHEARESEPSFGITEADVFGELLRKRVEPRLLGFYSRYRLEIVVEHYGLAEHIRKRGYPHFEMVLQGDSSVAPTVVVYGDTSRREVLLELASKELVLAPPAAVTVECAAGAPPFKRGKTENVNKLGLSLSELTADQRKELKISAGVLVIPFKVPSE